MVSVIVGGPGAKVNSKNSRFAAPAEKSVSLRQTSAGATTPIFPRDHENGDRFLSAHPGRPVFRVGHIPIKSIVIAFMWGVLPYKTIYSPGRRHPRREGGIMANATKND